MKTRLWLLSTLLVLSGCAGFGANPEPRQLLLTYDGPMAPAEQAKTVLVIRAVSVPDYLDRRDIVYRLGPELRSYGEARWAERPGKAITRYLAQALDAQRTDYRVQPLTSASGMAPEAALTVVIDRFEAEGAGPVQLRGHWSLTAPGRLLASGRFDADAPRSGDTVDANVVAMQQALLAASHALAIALPSS